MRIGNGIDLCKLLSVRGVHMIAWAVLKLYASSMRTWAAMYDRAQDRIRNLEKELAAIKAEAGKRRANQKAVGTGDL